ncbi:MAG: HEAT repeat domain-containing protein [Azoarcus sp.]|nr:HEAT repeat domain-containing protein [Azoarcus sp.]
MTKTQFDIFEYGMRQSSELVFSTYSGKFICRLSYHFEEVRVIYKRLVNDKSSAIRYNAVTLTLDRPPEDIIRYILEKTYHDKSSKVRKKVADVCLRLNFNQMLPLLEQQYNIEHDDEVRIGLHFSIELLKNGYLIETLSDEKMNLMFKSEAGISGRLFDKKYLDVYTIKDIINSCIEKKKFPWE